MTRLRGEQLIKKPCPKYDSEPAIIHLSEETEEKMKTMRAVTTKFKASPGSVTELDLQNLIEHTLHHIVADISAMQMSEETVFLQGLDVQRIFD